MTIKPRCLKSRLVRSDPTAPLSGVGGVNNNSRALPTHVGSSLVFRSKKGNDGHLAVVFLFSRYKLTNTQIFAHIVAQTVSNETSAKLSGTRLQPQWQSDLNRCIKYKEPFRLLVLSISSFMNNKTYTTNSFNSSFNCLQLGKYRFNSGE